MKEVDLYVDEHYLEITKTDPEEPPQIIFLFRDKQSQAGFPMVFDKPLAEILIEAIKRKVELPMNAFRLNQRLLSYGVIKLVKAAIFKIQDNSFWMNLYFLVNGEKKIECVNTVVALEAALRNQAPITIPENIFLKAIENPEAQRLLELFEEKKDQISS